MEAPGQPLMDANNMRSGVDDPSAFLAPVPAVRSLSRLSLDLPELLFVALKPILRRLMRIPLDVLLPYALRRLDSRSLQGFQIIH